MTLVGIAVGTLTVGMLLPFVVGERVASGPVTAGEALPELESVPAAASEETGGAVAGDPGPTSGEPGPGRTTASSPVSDRGPDPGPPPGVTLGASDVGVTDTSIKVGILLLDLGGANQLGFGAAGLPSIAEQQRYWEVFLAEVNEAGGILGRTIEPVFRSYDALDNTSREAACLALADDAKVFAILESTGGFNSTPVLCVTERFKVPLFVGGNLNQTSDEIIRRSNGLLVGLSTKGSRMLAMATHVWHELGLLKGKTIGVLDYGDLGNPQVVDAGLVKTLKELGYAVKARYIFDVDQSSAASQVPIAVQEMRSAGVDLIVNASYGLYVAQFTQAADAQGYRPTYVSSDWLANGSDFAAQNNSAGYNGTVIATTGRVNDRAGYPISGPEKRCVEILTRRAGTAPDRDDQDGYFAVAAYDCALVELFTRAAREAGPSLTRSGLSAAAQRLGRLDLPMFGAGRFAPGKFDLADDYMIQRWEFTCRCFRYVSGPHPGRR